MGLCCCLTGTCFVAGASCAQQGRPSAAALLVTALSRALVGLCCHLATMWCVAGAWQCMHMALPEEHCCPSTLDR